MNSARYPIVMALLLCLVYGLASASVRKESTRLYPLQSDGTFELSNINGTVRIETWDRDEVEVKAVKSTNEEAAALDQVDIDVSAKPDALVVATRYPGEGAAEVAVDYTIHVPRMAKLVHLSTVNGTLKIMEAQNLGDVHTVNGNIEIYQGSGKLHAHTTNGNVYLELKQPEISRGVSAETTNGSVLLALPANTRASLEARCMNGNFSSELPFIIQGSDERVVHGRLGRGGTQIHLGTVNGAIRVVELKSTL